LCEKKKKQKEKVGEGEENPAKRPGRIRVRSMPASGQKRWEKDPKNNTEKKI